MLYYCLKCKKNPKKTKKKDKLRSIDPKVSAASVRNKWIIK